MDILERIINQRFGGEWPHNFTVDLSESQAVLAATVAGIPVDKVPEAMRAAARRRGYQSCGLNSAGKFSFGFVRELKTSRMLPNLASLLA